MILKVLVTGSRTWPRPWIVKSYLDKTMAIVLDELWNGRHDMWLIHGHCPKGVDAFADEWAEEVGCFRVRYPVDWKNDGWNAGKIRNLKMIQIERPHICIAFIHNNSGGASHCLKEAKLAGIETIAIRINDK